MKNRMKGNISYKGIITFNIVILFCQLFIMIKGIIDTNRFGTKVAPLITYMFGIFGVFIFIIGLLYFIYTGFKYGFKNRIFYNLTQTLILLFSIISILIGIFYKGI